jgi:nucleoside-diphosphate-sugar epimerase
MKRILITGASGFIGSFLVAEALKKNYETTAGIRKTSNKKYLQDSRIHFLELDFHNKNKLKEQLLQAGKFDYIIHNAGLTKTCKTNDFEQVNYINTRNFIEILQENNQIPEKFIFISSLEAYGPGKPGTKLPVKDSDKPKPATLYGKSKLKAEKYIKSLTDFPWLIMRPTGVYGPREKDYFLVFKSIKQGIETYIGQTDQHLTFIYVKDLTRLLIDMLESKIIHCSYFGSDLKYYTSRKFNNLIKKELNKKTIILHLPKSLVKLMAYINGKLACLIGKTPTLNPDKYYIISQSNWLCDSSPLVTDFNFKPEYDLEKGVKETVKWYLDEGWL